MLMNRGRDYRRYVLELNLKKRLNRALFSQWYWWRGFTTINCYKVNKPNITDYIGTSFYKTFKTCSTTRYDSYNKMKYSSNRKNYCGDKVNTRENDKHEFIKILKEYGIK